LQQGIFSLAASHADPPTAGAYRTEHLPAMKDKEPEAYRLGLKLKNLFDQFKRMNTF
jgi:hypothetical protein